MIFFCAINDVSTGSKFHNNVELPSMNKEEIRWGITELSSSTFHKINNDDHIFFYCNGKIIGIGKVLKTFIDKELSIMLWGVNQHKFKGTTYWSNIVSFSNYNSVFYPFEEIIRMGNYSDKFSIRRVIQLNSVGMQNIIERFGSEDGFVKHVLKIYPNKNQFA